MKSAFAIAVSAGFVAAMTPEELHATLKDLSETNSNNLKEVDVPVQLQGANLTLENCRKWLTTTVTFGGHDAEDQELSQQAASDATQLAADADPMDLINPFLSAWSFVKDNLPVSDVAGGQYAAALPSNAPFDQVNCARSDYLDTSEDKPHFIKWTNWFGVETGVVEYSLRWDYGCKYGSGSQYIAQATQQVWRTHAEIGFKLECKSTSPPPSMDGGIPAIKFDLVCSSNGDQSFDHWKVRGDGYWTRIGTNTEFAAGQILV